MKHKRNNYESGLVALLLLSNLAHAQGFTVDFSDVEGFGVNSEKVQINDIFVTWDSPFDPAGVTVPYVLDFKVCQSVSGRRYLRPILTAEEPACSEALPPQDAVFSEAAAMPLVSNGVYLSNSYVENVDINRVRIEQIGIRNPDYPEAITRYDNIVFKFDPETLDLEECHVCILFEWRDDQLELDAHLTGPAPGVPEDYNHEPDRFHLYFRSQYNEVSELKRPIELGNKQQEVFIFPPRTAKTLRPGRYRFTVHHYEDNYSGSNNNIAQSGALVSLWIGDGTKQVFRPPTDSHILRGEMGDIWRVFELHVADDGKVTVVPIQNYDVDVIPSEVY